MYVFQTQFQNNYKNIETLIENSHQFAEVGCLLSKWSLRDLTYDEKTTSNLLLNNAKARQFYTIVFYLFSHEQQTTKQV